MKHISHTKAHLYLTSSKEVAEAAMSFIESVKAWGQSYEAAIEDLKSFVSSKAKARPIGMLSADSMNMSSFGFVFESNPGPGFIRVPSEVARKLESQSLRGEGYFPDTSHPLGREVMDKLNQVSRICEQRPLMSGVPGVLPAVVEDNRLILSRAYISGGQLLIAAAPSAIKNQNDFKAVEYAEAAYEGDRQESRAAAVRRPSMRL